jgi:hypothetical protein
MRFHIEVKVQTSTDVQDENGVWWESKNGAVSSYSDSGQDIVADMLDGGMGEGDPPEIIITDKEAIKLYTSRL